MLSWQQQQHTQQEEEMTSWSEEYKNKYGFGGWPKPTTSVCPYCNGSGMADADNECGFCDDVSEVDDV